MKIILSSLFMVLVLTSCNFWHKANIDQGNILEHDHSKQLHIGMSEAEVKAVMGTPVLTNLFHPGRMDYVYTFQQGHHSIEIKRITCIFINGRLYRILSNMS